MAYRKFLDCKRKYRLVTGLVEAVPAAIINNAPLPEGMRRED